SRLRLGRNLYGRRARGVYVGDGQRGDAGWGRAGQFIDLLPGEVVSAKKGSIQTGELYHRAHQIGCCLEMTEAGLVEVTLCFQNVAERGGSRLITCEL